MYSTVSFVSLHLYICYTEDSILFTVKVHNDGDFDEKLENYVGGMISYFDNCSLKNLSLLDVESMLSELGQVKGSVDIWYCIPDLDFGKGLCQIESTEDVMSMSDMICYSHCLLCTPQKGYFLMVIMKNFHSHSCF